MTPTIVIDTREPPETAWTFGDLPVVRRKLEAGDYSIEGFENEVAIERKTSADLVSTLTFGRSRFERELDLLRLYPRAVIFVEGDLESIIRAQYRSRVSPAALVGSFGSFFGRWGISTVFCGSAFNAAILAKVYLLKAHKHLTAQQAEVA